MAQGVILLSPTNIPLAIRDCMLVKTGDAANLLI